MNQLTVANQFTASSDYVLTTYGLSVDKAITGLVDDKHPEVDTLVDAYSMARAIHGGLLLAGVVAPGIVASLEAACAMREWSDTDSLAAVARNPVNKNLAPEGFDDQTKYPNQARRLVAALAGIMYWTHEGAISHFAEFEKEHYDLSVKAALLKYVAMSHLTKAIEDDGKDETSQADHNSDAESRQSAFHEKYNHLLPLRVFERGQYDTLVDILSSEGSEQAARDIVCTGGLAHAIDISDFNFRSLTADLVIRLANPNISEHTGLKGFIINGSATVADLSRRSSIEDPLRNYSDTTLDGGFQLRSFQEYKRRLDTQMRKARISKDGSIIFHPDKQQNGVCPAQVAFNTPRIKEAANRLISDLEETSGVRAKISGNNIPLSQLTGLVGIKVFTLPESGYDLFGAGLLGDRRQHIPAL